MPSTVNLQPDYPDKQIAKPEALHTAARRYLMDQMDTDRSMTWVRGRDADGTLRIDIRYLHSTAGAAIEEQVERIGPSNYRSLEDLRAVLLQIGRTADDPYLRQVTDPSELSEIERERGQFCEYISGLSPAALRLVEPLPYRRLLSERESRRLWHKLDKRWGTSFDSYWYPLREDPPSPGVLPLQAAWFWREIPPTQLAAILVRHKVKRVWQPGNDSRHLVSGEYEVGLELLELGLVGPPVEAYWTSDTLDWLLYISHEDSVTVAGDWLVAAVKEVWPEWEQHRYTGWDYERPD